MSQQGRALPGPARGEPPLDRHTYSLRVYYEDTDAGGVVYHARYLGMAERARTEALRDAGAPHAALAADHGLGFVVHRLAIEYHRPARLDDLLAVDTTLAAVSAARLSLRQTIRRDATPLVTLAVDLACVDAAGRPARIPPRWRALEASMGSAQTRKGSEDPLIP
ncbi:MAG: tol-pal system-associated acyl-CoA thioesterase [Janthinobacterium lividum]